MPAKLLYGYGAIHLNRQGLTFPVYKTKVKLLFILDGVAEILKSL